jgi:hypothetical protein
LGELGINLQVSVVVIALFYCSLQKYLN